MTAILIILYRQSFVKIELLCNYLRGQLDADIQSLKTEKMPIDIT